MHMCTAFCVLDLDSSDCWMDCFRIEASSKFIQSAGGQAYICYLRDVVIRFATCMESKVEL